MGDILRMADEPLKKSYTVKLVAVKDGEIGVLSKRVEMKQIEHKKTDEKLC
jgi:hypothetical protein